MKNILFLLLIIACSPAFSEAMFFGSGLRIGSENVQSQRERAQVQDIQNDNALYKWAEKSTATSETSFPARCESLEMIEERLDLAAFENAARPRLSEPTALAQLFALSWLGDCRVLLAEEPGWRIAITPLLWGEWAGGDAPDLLFLFEDRAIGEASYETRTLFLFVDLTDQEAALTLLPEAQNLP